ncbi:hypothetical protein AX17_001848 [Amanita inopinata Kibby_2008]|nr:hypothetical protein AX17_001848 [Amanita inopinata Kibby_2008]
MPATHPGLVISLSSSPLSSSPPSHPPCTSLSRFSASSSTHTRSSSTQSAEQPQRTNTLAIATLPRSFFAPEVLNIMQTHFNFFGEINRWVPLPGFGRIIVVYENEDHAEEAKRACDPIILQGEEEDESAQMVLRVYRADPNPLLPKPSQFDNQGYSTVPQANYLRPPALEKNFLISPPGSPPVGWEQVKEDPPNATPLAEDLMSMLRRLEMYERKLNEYGSPRLEVLVQPEEAGIGVYVEDCDFGLDASEEMKDEDWVYGETCPTRNRWTFAPTAIPPMNNHTLVV